MSQKFNYLLEKGKQTEQLIANVLTQRGFKVTDVSDDKQYQDIDVDFIINKGNRGDWKLEVKSDSKINNTGNFLIERGFDRRTGYYQGWYYKCKADYLCIFDSVANKAYILDWDKTKEYARVNGKNISWWNYSDDCRGYATLVGIADAKRAKLIEHVYDLGEMSNTIEWSN